MHSVWKHVRLSEPTTKIWMKIDPWQMLTGLERLEHQTWAIYTWSPATTTILASWLAYDQRLEALNLWTLEERRVRADLIEVYKIINGLSAAQFHSFFELDTNTRTRGHSLKLKKKSFHTELREHFFSERIINFWNSLDEETVTASTLNSFKNNLVRLRKHKHMKIGHVLGKWLCLWTYEAEPAAKPHN